MKLSDDITDVSSLDAGTWRGRAILLLDLDAFFASVEQMDHPAWKGRPVIVGGDADKRGVVSTCSYEARAFGVHSAMPASTARKLCPDAIWVSGRFGRYREISRQVMRIMRDESPFIQQVSIDEAFLDITPTAHRTESPLAIASRIQGRVNAIGITCSIGLGVSKSVAKIASDFDKPNGMTVVYPGREREFLAPLPIKTMSGIGPVSQEKLRAFGIRTLGDVAAADASVLSQIFGKNAVMMRDRCLGADTDPVVDGDPAKSVSNEISFARDLSERSDIEAAIATVAAKVARRLRMNGLRCSTITLKVRYEDRSARSAQGTLPHPSDDEYEFTEKLDRLLDEVWEPGMHVRLVGAAATRFDEPVSVQESLPLLDAETDSSAQAQAQAQMRVRDGLKSATDKVRNRFGEDAIQFGREMRTKGNLTGSASKNPADYKSAHKEP